MNTTNSDKTPSSASVSLEPFEIFRAGTHTPMSGKSITITTSMLQACAQAYDPSKHESPLVVGHPKTDDPAYGWVERLSMQGDSLFAHPKDVDPDFTELVRQRRYTKISSSFLMPDAANNPVPGTLYLKHVGFLGAAAPAVKGMKPVKFACFDSEVLTFGDDSGDNAFQRMTDIRNREAVLSRKENETLVERMMYEGRVLPVFRESILSFMDGLGNETQLEFSEGGQTQSLGQLDWFKRYLSLMPSVVPLGMSKPSDGEAFASGGFQVPKGHMVDRDGMEMHSLIEAHARQHSISFAEAAMALARNK